MRKIFLTKKGVTLVELLVTISIITVIGFLVSNFQRDVFSLNSSLQSSLSAQLDGRKIVKNMVGELRSASPSSLGAYPIVSIGTSTITFYSDTNNDGLKEKVRYYLDAPTKKLKKGVITPSGSPLTYSGSEELSIVINDVVNGTSTPIFTYYDSNYTGTTSPLTYPIDTLAVRLVKVNVIIDKDPNRSPVPITVSSQVSIRNLKNNL